MLPSSQAPALRKLSTNLVARRVVTAGRGLASLIFAVLMIGAVTAKQAAATPVPAAPTNLTETYSSAAITFNWMASTGASEYILLSSNTSGSGYTEDVITTFTTTVVVPSLNGATQYFEVEAVAGTGSNQVTSLPSNQVAFVPLQGMDAYVGNGQVTLTWPQPPNVPSGASFTYSVYRSSNVAQMVTLGNGNSGGTFTLSYGGQTTAALAYNATAAQVQTALGALSSIGTGNVSVSEVPSIFSGALEGGPYVVTFLGSLANQPVSAMSGTGALTGTNGVNTVTVAPAVVTLSTNTTNQYYVDQPGTSGNTDTYYVTATSTASTFAGTVTWYYNFASGRPLLRQIIHNFGGGSAPVTPTGGLVLNTDGNLYGVSTRGGLFDQGAVFQLTPAGAITTLYSFTGGADGSAPVGPLSVGPGGMLYGATSAGGQGYGTLFSITPGGSLSTLASFDDTNGASPLGGFAYAQSGDGQTTSGATVLFLGVTAAGGTNNAGVLYELTSTGQINVLHDFVPMTEGSPSGGLTSGSGGVAYGVTGNGGLENAGNLYSYSTGLLINIIYSFGSNVGDGSQPTGQVTVLADGSVAGTTASGGSFGFGTIFDVAKSSGGLTSTPTVYNFTGGVDGAAPNGLIESNSTVNNLPVSTVYGTTTSGGADSLGTIYAYTEGATTTTTLHTFTGGALDGDGPTGPLAIDSAGNLYGLTASGGASAVGFAYRVSAQGTFFDLASFAGSPVGINPIGAPLQGADGNLYGAASTGGTADEGVLFGITPATDAFKAFYSFAVATPAIQPATSLVQSGSGLLTGITTTGQIFNSTPQGSLAFAPGGTVTASGFQGLTYGSNGSTLYGVAAEGGTDSLGEVFSYAGGTTSTIYSFPGGANGSTPSGPLCLGADGNLYGVATGGGLNGDGIVYVVSGGSESKLADLGTTAGIGPVGGLVQAADQTFYGVTQSGGFGAQTVGGSAAGTIFSVTPTGTLTVLYSFTGLGDGGSPNGRLLIGRDGNIYGTTSAGGAYGSGTIFCLTPSGSLVAVDSFPAATQQPATGLIQGADTNFYGFTSAGGTFGLGTAYRLAIPGLSVPEPTITILAPSSALVGGPTFTLVINGNNFTSGAVAIWTNGSTATPLVTSFVSANELTATVPASLIAGPGAAQVTVTNPGGLNPNGVSSTAVSFSINYPSPTVSTISPTGIQVGSPSFTLTITGTNFTPGTVVQFNGQNLPSTVINLGEITATVPATDVVSPGTAEVGVNNVPPLFPAGGGSATVPFAINNPAPVIVTLSQTVAPVNSAQISLVVAGSGFLSASVVYWSGTALATTFNSTGQLTATVPASLLQTIGSFTISVQNPGPGGGPSNQEKFTVTPAIVHTFAPGLQMISAPFDYSQNPLADAFDVAAPRLAVWEPTENQYIISPNSPADSIRPGVGYWVRFSTSADLFDTGIAESPSDSVPIALTAGWNMVGDPFNAPIPISNMFVLDASGNQTTLAEANAEGIVSVTFFSYDTASNAYVPATLGGAIYPYSGYWIQAFATCALVISPPVPAITSLSASSGAPGTSVVITGSGFTGATQVEFGGVAAPSGSFTVNSDDEITVTVPASAVTGTVSVTTQFGTATSTQVFVVT